MEILYINGETDSFSAMILMKEYGLDKLVEMTRNSNNWLEIDDDKLEVYATLVIKKFGDVDPEFLKFLHANDLLLDYDMSKHSDFYVIEE